MSLTKKLILGTAQFGQNYGITNVTGKVSEVEIKSIFRNARLNQIHTLDTASTYGDSEPVLGNIGVSDFDVITKLPSLGSATSDCYEIYKKSIEGSLKDLKMSRIDTVLLHRPEELISSYGDTIYNALHKLKDDGLVDRIGISIYSPELLDNIYPKYFFDVIQAPLNIFDRRIISSGWLGRLSEMGVSVIARSVFLQGILLSQVNDLPAYFSKWRPLFMQWIEFYQENGLSALEASLQFIVQVPEIDKIIVGVESEHQLTEIVRVINNPVIIEYNDLETDDLGLISPVHWPS
jgi:aryl-alcohol dehydrogenase-like predicted oxidoreductase